MSHDATNWAIKQRGLKPAAKLVLWHLCDRYHPDHGCFPSQETLAADCEISRSTLNENLTVLEQAGLIVREQRWNEQTNRQKSTVYRFAFENGFNPKPCPESGHGNEGKAVSGNDQKPCPENAESRVRNPDTNPVREPVRVTSNLREGVREAEKGEDRTETPKVRHDRIEAAFWALVKDWPNFAPMPKEPAKRAWHALCDADRASAIAGFPAWMASLKGGRRDHVPAPSTYFREKLWNHVPSAARAASGKAGSAVAAPFGKAWGAMRLMALREPSGPLPAPSAFMKTQIAQGGDVAAKALADMRSKHGWPQVSRMHEKAANGQGMTATAQAVALGDGFGVVHVGSALFEAWKRLHERRCWPWLPDMGRQAWVYFPPTDGDTDTDVEAAVAAFYETLNGDRSHDHAA